MGAARPAWRSSLLALCLLPVALPLLLLCLPLLCVAVAAARFRRRRRKLMMAAAAAAAGEGRTSSCRLVAPGGWPAPEAEGDDGNRAELLHKYLQDQMELVGADGGAGGSRPSSQRSQLQH